MSTAPSFLLAIEFSTLVSILTYEIKVERDIKPSLLSSGGYLRLPTLSLMLQSTEDLSTNPFMTVLRSNFEKLYRSVATKQAILLVPCAASLVGIPITQVFIELRNGCISTSFGFKEQRVCNVLKEENMYDQSAVFKVVCIDRPLQGRFEGSLTASLRESKQSNFLTALDSESVLETMKNWLQGSTLSAPLEAKIKSFEKTYVLTAGLENDAARRIAQICSEMQLAIDSIWRISQQNPLKHQQLYQIVERYAYIRLYPFLWNHLLQSLSAREAKLKKGILFHIRDKNSLLESLQVRPILCTIDVKLLTEKLETMESLQTPHEKLSCLQAVHKLIYSAIEDRMKKQLTYTRESIEVSADDVLGLLISTVGKSMLSNGLAHLAHMEMLISTQCCYKPLEKSNISNDVDIPEIV
ncbi:hypothetical protein IE077_001874 [Cardiosporidium cionae]|uniref:VPS9 domain-containing protein n=1 Tax=Cardiosporidium cionae TaxID=476202 RepID=A0ABQ7JC38_9APIC|nr:hypothetical protein IE077_001874 [Cardiosporidium cionae]|eukprot:KAF8821559.1 hypothetical protein IE077_001874 [Cardiosporidium cionae]